MRINKYWKTKRTYNRKNKFNKTYRGGKTLHTKETEKAFGKFLIIGTIAMYLFCGTYVFATKTRTITIINDELVQTNSIVEQEEIGAGIDNLPVPIAPVLTVEEQIREIAKEHNFKWTDYLVRLAFYESSLNPRAVNDNGKYGIDWGLFQWNDYYHPEMKDCALDIRCSTIATMEAINNGNQHWWVANEKAKNKSLTIK